VDATPIVARVARAIGRHRLEAVLIGNAAAAMHGAPVTTIDMDFFIRRAPGNRKKLIAIAAELRATVYRPFYPVGRVVRMMNDDETLQVDFMEEVNGVRSFEGVRQRAREVRVGDAAIRLAALVDIVEMKRATNRPRDRAVLDILEKTLKPRRQTRKQRRAGLKAQSEWLENDMIRRRVAAPLERRMNFLRKRIGICSSCL
jgi:predicted nucleotidyltransferase